MSSSFSFLGTHYDVTRLSSREDAEWIVRDGRKAWQIGKEYFYGPRASLVLLAQHMSKASGEERSIRPVK